jgi:hypothetical protein
MADLVLASDDEVASVRRPAESQLHIRPDRETTSSFFWPIIGKKSNPLEIACESWWADLDKGRPGTVPVTVVTLVGLRVPGTRLIKGRA